MGFIDRLINGVNAAAQPFQDLDTRIFHDRSLSRADKLAAAGAAAAGTVVGISRHLEDSVEHQSYAVEVTGADGAPMRFGVEVGDRAQGRLRLGLPVIVRTDGKRAVLDLGSMFAAWDVPGGDAIQRSVRKPPADGIDDRARESRITRRLERWSAATATIASLRAVTALGMATDNWDVTVTLPDGSTSTSARDLVPRYAYFAARPGAVVPVAVDPDDPSRCVIDWLAVASSAAGPIAFADDPAPDSILGRLEAAAPAPTEAMGAAPSGDGTVAGRDVAASDATMESWFEAWQAGALKPKAYHRTVDDWRAAGMCTEEQAAAAHARVPPA